jgi:MFS family permease
MVTLAQTASTLSMMLLALPAGVLANAFDRRWPLFAVQTNFIAVGLLLAVLTAAGLMPLTLLLAFTFAIGADGAVLSPTWRALITDLVPRNELAAATRHDMVSVNVARAAGPAMAGLVIADLGCRAGLRDQRCCLRLPWPWCFWRGGVPRVRHGEREP